MAARRRLIQPQPSPNSLKPPRYRLPRRPIHGHRAQPDPTPQSAVIPRLSRWDGSAFVDVPNPGAYPAADNTFNHVTFGSVTTTKLRVVLVSGLGSVGAIQWVVPSIPGS